MDRRVLAVSVDHGSGRGRRDPWTDRDRSPGLARTVRADRQRTGVDQTGRTGGPVRAERSAGTGSVRRGSVWRCRSGSRSGPDVGAQVWSIAVVAEAGSWRPAPVLARVSRPGPAAAPGRRAASVGAGGEGATRRGGCPQQLRPRNTMSVASGLGCCACSAAGEERVFACVEPVPAPGSGGITRNSRRPGPPTRGLPSTAAGPPALRSWVRCGQGGGV
jgi:hypothetical protein